MPSSSFEIKTTRGKNSLPMREITEEQVYSALANIGKRGNLIRVASGTVGAADYVYLREAGAYFVIEYPDFFCLIDAGIIDTLKKELHTSIPSKLAKEVAYKVIHT